MKVNSSHFEKKLLLWYHQNRRPLPWRLNGNPYRIFVVEIMLQQTQIKTVLPYYDRWLNAFPDIYTLAKAPLDKVLKLWEGLGYYSRARNLHKAAQIIVEQFNGKVPDNILDLMSLPGIGRYTAGAIASIAYQKPVPLVDGNVSRVFSRVFHLKDDISLPETQKKFYEIAEKIVSKKEPGNFNQALMELGSQICSPDLPKCHICPVAKMCIALKKGNPLELPVKSKGLKVKKMDMVVGILKFEDKLLVRRRPASGIWGGLWEIPGTVRTKELSLEKALTQEFEEEMGFHITILKKLKPIEHRFTHRFANIVPFECEIKALPGKLKNQNLRWVKKRALDQLSFPVPHQKIMASLRV